MRNLTALFLILCLCIFIGCLGMSGSGGSLVGPGGANLSAVLSGRAYFADRQLYGGIPVAVRNIAGQRVATVMTDEAGYFAFPVLAAGIYDVLAITGESEVVFARSVQIDGSTRKQINDTQLLSVKDAVIDNISSQSFDITFRSNRVSRASVEYGPVGGYQQVKTIGQAGATTHETTISGLSPLTEYEISIIMTGDDGQNFIMRGLFAATTGSLGPQNLSVAINEGRYETNSPNVTLFLEASNTTHMRISESYDMTDSSWVTYSQTYNFTFSNVSAGTRRVYVQFKDANGVFSPVQSDAILLNQGGYIGIWINDGAAITNSTDAILKTVFPGATHMLLANTSDFLNAYWEPYIETKRWRFNTGDGIKTIYARFKGGLADEKETFTATILLDTTPPEVQIKINGGSSVTATSAVTLAFDFSSPPTQMKISNTAAPATSQSWVSFKSTLPWQLTAGDGNKTVYGLFKDGANNEYGPVSSDIELDTVAPTGNTIALLEGELPTSNAATYTLIASLPIYLHFNVTDTTTYQAHYGITQQSTATPPTTLLSINSPFNPVALDANFLTVGSHKIWTVFTDKAGNSGYYQTANLKVDGPEIIVSPQLANLKSNEQQQFTATIKNIAMSDVGVIRWRIINGSGTIDSSGLYTAPGPIYQSSVATVRAESSLITSLSSQATVNLNTSVELLFRQANGQYTYEENDDQVAPGNTITANIKILHSDKGFEISKQPVAGTPSISPAVPESFGMVATLTYAAPVAAPAENPIIIGIRSIDSPTKAATITYLISTGPNLRLTPTSGDAQRNTPLNIAATVTGTASNTMTWTITPPGAGSFDPASIVTTKTTGSPDHNVTFYASTPIQITQASVTATIDGASKNCRITVYPPVKFDIDPPATSSLPIIAPITFKAQGFEYLLGNATEEVKWEFKNLNRVDFMPADGKTFLDRGSLTIINPTTAEYRRPSKLPSETDASATDTIIIRATSLADPLASATAIVSISPKVVVQIFDSIEKSTPISAAATVAEVGKLQFYADVTPSVIGNTSVSWTVNGTSGSSQYGTIDSNGLYIAPDEVFVNEVTIRATSNYDPTAFAAVTVSLSDFWLPRRTNMFDSVTGEVMPITALLVNPYTAIGQDFILYAGTSGYGLWRATFSDSPGNIDGGIWQSVDNLSVTNKNTAGRYQIGSLVISPNQHVFAGTADGIWYIPPVGSAIKVTGSIPANDLPDENYLQLSFDNQNPEYLFATTPRGVFKITLDLLNPQICTNWHLFINTSSRYKNDEIESRTDSTASPAVTIDAYSNLYNDNPINGILHTISYDEYNDRLYAGGEGGIFLFMNDSSIPNPIPNLIQVTDFAFTANAPSVAIAWLNFHLLSINQPKTAQLGAPPLALALDVVNRNTIWAATVGGVFRSVNNGMAWTAAPFGTGSTVNTRAIIVDPTNTINVLAGSEDGLYRSTDAGSSWKRVRSGLGNHKTITSLTQAAGLAGARRKVWVGTAGGVFMGKQSLDLE